MPTLVGLGLALSLAPEQPRRVTLDWRAPAVCPGPAAVRAEIDELLAGAGDSPAGAETVRASGRVFARNQATWAIAIELTIDGERSRREIEGASCQALTSAAAFIIATAVDPRVATRPPPAVPPSTDTVDPPVAADPEPPGTDPEPPSAGQEPSLASDRPGDADDPGSDASTRVPAPVEAAGDRADPTPTPGPSTPAPGPEAPPTTPDDARPRRPRLALGTMAGVGFGPTPRVAAVLGLGVAAVGRAWRVALHGEYWTPSTATSSVNPAVGVQVQAWDLVVRGCGVLRRGRVEVPLCGGLGAGALRGRGTGDLATRRAASAGWIRVLGGPGVLFAVTPRVAVGARVDGSLTLAGGAFRTEPSGRAYEPRLGAVSGGALLEFRLP